MNSKQSFAVVGITLLCGLALAQTPKVQTPDERITALEKEVAALRVQLAPGQGPWSEELGALRKELAETRALANQLAAWANGQADGAAELSRTLDESELKGFTYGINPDSRTVLLAGWRSFNAGLQENVPQPLPAPGSELVKDAKAPAQVPVR